MTKVNLITGFLGSGKTTTLRHLLANKPENEKWAVLVNEFGEIGIDGSLLADTGAVLKEIPGGCMCCVNGLPMQVGLNMLLQQAKPDRLLIEPTGDGGTVRLLPLRKVGREAVEPVVEGHERVFPRVEHELELAEIVRVGDALRTRPEGDVCLSREPVADGVMVRVADRVADQHDARVLCVERIVGIVDRPFDVLADAGGLFWLVVSVIHFYDHAFRTNCLV